MKKLIYYLRGEILQTEKALLNEVRSILVRMLPQFHILILKVMQRV